ncbi:MAG: cyclic nucleotide-binding domain-containing protein [Deltaproteobacteria bacterium]|nr:cyclic nucleotide-binding domain-containing protein [Deltaproteobacteria bacterium]
MSDIDLLKKASIFAKLTDDQLKKIVSSGEQKKIGDGDLVFKEGDSGHEAYVVVEGRVQITMEMDRPTEQAPVHTVAQGRLFGEFALVSDHERSASARAVKDTVLFTLSRETFDRLCEEDPRLGYLVLYELSQILVGRLVKTTRELRASLMF